LRFDLRPVRPAEIVAHPADANRALISSPVLFKDKLTGGGDPTGTAKFHATRNPHNAVWTLAVAPDEQQLFEAGWGSPDVTVWKIDPTGAPVDSVTVTIPGQNDLTQARAVRHGKLAVQPTAAGATVTLPLRTVDVLLFPAGTPN